MKISYAFSCGRVETLFKLSNFLKFGTSNNVLQEEEIVERYRNSVFSSKSFEETELFKSIENEENPIIANRLKSVFRENRGRKEDPFVLKDYTNGVWHELNDYKLALRFLKAKELLIEKYLKKTGMQMTIRDIAAMTGWNQANIKTILNHKRSAVATMVSTLEKMAEAY